MNTRSIPLGAVSAILAALFASGCASAGTLTPGYLGNNQFTVSPGAHNAILGFDSSRRAAYLSLDDAGHIVGVCAEPPPETAATLGTSYNVSASGQATAAGGVTGGGAVTVNGTTVQNVTDLAKTTSETLFLREILFRRCEARMNRHPGHGEDAVRDEHMKKDAADDAFFTALMKTYVELSTAHTASAPSASTQTASKAPAPAPAPATPAPAAPAPAPVALTQRK
jgi:hypothetical protein